MKYSSSAQLDTFLAWLGSGNFSLNSLLKSYSTTVTLLRLVNRLGFPTARDSATFRDKGTEVPFMSRDKGTKRQAQNLPKGRVGSGQPVKLRDGTLNGTEQDFDSLSRPVPRDKTRQSRKGYSKTEKNKNAKITFTFRHSCL